MDRGSKYHGNGVGIPWVGVNISWIGGSQYWVSVNIPWEGDQNTMGRGVKIPMESGSLYHW